MDAMSLWVATALFEQIYADISVRADSTAPSKEADRQARHGNRKVIDECRRNRVQALCTLARCRRTPGHKALEPG